MRTLSVIPERNGVQQPQFGWRLHIIALLLLVGSAGAAVAQQNNNVQVACTANGSPTTFYLCQDGNSCGRIQTDGPAPFNSANSGQDNVDFTGLVNGQSATVTYQLERVVVPSFTYSPPAGSVFNDVQSNPANGVIIDTSNVGTTFSVATTAPAGPFTITKSNSVSSTRHSINLDQPSSYPNPKPKYNFLKYTVTCVPVVKTIPLNIEKQLPNGGTGTFKFDLKNGNVILTTQSLTAAGTISNFATVTQGVQYTLVETITSPDTFNTTASCVGATTSYDQQTRTITLTPAFDATKVDCKFINSRQVAGNIPFSVEKELPNGGTGTFTFDLRQNGALQSSVSRTSAGISQLGNFAPALTYTLSETIVSSDTFATTATCTGAQQVSYDVPTRTLTFTPAVNSVGVSCKFTNTKAPVQTIPITVEKVLPNGGTGTFNFTRTGNNGVEATASLPGQGTAGLGTVIAGEAYQISESIISANTFATVASCTGTSSTTYNAFTRTISLTPTAGANAVACKFTNTRSVGSIVIEKKTVGGFGAFSYTTTAPPGNSFNVPTLDTTAQNPISVTFNNLDPGQYSVTENVPADWQVTDVSCSPNQQVTQTTASIDLTAGGQVKCTFTNFKKSDDPMEEETERFIHRRVDNLLTYGPDRARMLRRLQDPPQQQQSLKDEPLKLGAVSTSLGGASAAGGGSFGQMDAMSALPSSANRMAAVGSTLGSNPFAKAKLPGDETDDEEVVGYGQQAAPSMFSQVAGQFTPLVNGQGSYSFSTSLSELRAAAVAAEEQNSRKKLQDAGLSLASQPYTNPYLTSRQGLDVWVEGHVAKYDDNVGGISREGDFRLLYIGADYLLRPGFLIGALVQIDDTNEDIDDPIRSGKIDGTGWLAGPYVGIKVLENLYFDARAAWGQSDNDIELTDAAGSRSGSFDTDRWLATASLTGNERFGAWRFSPQIAIAYGSESSDAYTNSLGQSVGSTDAKIGRLTGTAEVGYRFQRANGTVIEPHVALTGIWNFDSDDLIVNGVVVDTEESRAKVDGGVLITLPSGLGVRGAASYDGIGADDYHAVSGSLWLNVPLN